MRHVRVMWLLATLAALAAGACDDDEPAAGKVLFARGANCDPANKSYDKSKNCPALPPEPVVPSFPEPGRALMAPVRVAATASGWLLVADATLRMVLRVDPVTLVPDQAFRVRGRPLAVGMLGGWIYVGNDSTQSVEVYDERGRLSGYLGGAGAAGYPLDLAIDPDAGLVFVLDGLAPDVKVFDAESGVLVWTLAAGRLLAPAGLTVDPGNGELFVSDYGSSSEDPSVKVFSYAEGDAFGTKIDQVWGTGDCGWFGGCSNGFSRPRSPAVDAAGRLWIPDALLGQVAVFDRATKKQVGVLGTGDPAVSDLRIPSDVVLDGLGRVFVASTMTKRIVAFQESEGTP